MCGRESRKRDAEEEERQGRPINYHFFNTHHGNTDVNSPFPPTIKHHNQDACFLFASRGSPENLGDEMVKFPDTVVATVDLWGSVTSALGHRYHYRFLSLIFVADDFFLRVGHPDDGKEVNWRCGDSLMSMTLWRALFWRRRGIPLTDRRELRRCWIILF